MSVIDIPGDELEQMAALVPRLQGILTSTGMEGFFRIGRAPSDVGDSALDGSITNFETRWTDGIYQLDKELGALADGAKKITDNFDKTDSTLRDALEGKLPAPDPASDPTDPNNMAAADSQYQYNANHGDFNKGGDPH